MPEIYRVTFVGMFMSNSVLQTNVNWNLILTKDKT